MPKRFERHGVVLRYPAGWTPRRISAADGTMILDVRSPTAKDGTLVGVALYRDDRRASSLASYAKATAARRSRGVDPRTHVRSVQRVTLDGGVAARRITTLVYGRLRGKAIQALAVDTVAVTRDHQYVMSVFGPVPKVEHSPEVRRVERSFRVPAG